MFLKEVIFNFLCNFAARVALNKYPMWRNAVFWTLITAGVGNAFMLVYAHFLQLFFSRLTLFPFIRKTAMDKDQ